MFHLGAVTVVRGHEVGADKQQDDMGRVQVLLNLVFPGCPGVDVGIAPDSDEAASLQRHEVLSEALHEVLVLASVTAEDFDGGWHRRLLRLPHPVLDGDEQIPVRKTRDSASLLMKNVYAARSIRQF